jgi:predicted NAD/FAD-binding protein
MQRVAVVGGGVAGIVSAYLLQRRYQVDLWEAGSYLGGHTNTHVIRSGPDAGLAIDTGFIVLNPHTYENFLKFLGELGVATQLSDMSFGYHCCQTGWTYGGHDLATLFARPYSWSNPDFLRFVLDIARFNSRSLKALRQGRLQGSLRDYLRGYSRAFWRHYIEPLGSAIWSAPLHAIGDFPAHTFIRFFANHGLFELTNRPDWYTVAGGSHSYVKAFQANFQGRIFLDAPVQLVQATSSGWEIGIGGESQSYDACVLATHADITLKLLAQPSAAQQELLSPWRYLANRAVLHWDESFLLPNPKVRSSWSYTRFEEASELPTLSYDMNLLQALRGQRHYLVTLNSPRAIAADKTEGEWIYHHPQFDAAAVSTQARLPELNRAGLAFAGSYHRYGFHEDAVLSAVRAAASLGVVW